MPLRSRVARFDQGRYWSERGDRYHEEFVRHTPATAEVFRRQEEEVAEILSGYDFSDVKSVLEVGCGFGRLTPIILAALPTLQRYSAIDISSGQIAAAKAAFNSAVEAEFTVGDIRTATIQPVDFLFAGEVFLHFPPTEIGSVVKRALALSTYLVHLDPFIPRPPLTLGERATRVADRVRRHQPVTTTDWQHDFPRLYPEKVVSIHPVPAASQHLFVVR
jgi:SAM-dependent methyltransferase